jgi:hypothetical protein
MKYKNQYLNMLFALIVILGTGVLINRATAQDSRDGKGAVKYLEEQFRKQNIPVVTINILQEDPLQLEFIIQSESAGEIGTPVDPINFHMVRREAALAQRQGYIIARITRIFLNKNGVQVSKSDVSIKSGDIILLDLPLAKINDATVKEMALSKMNSLEMSVGDLSVSSMDGFQTLHAVQVASSLDEANKIGLGLRGGLHSILADLNQQGAQIVMTHVEIKDSNGDYYFNYIYDLQLGSESWWMADGFDDSWFPHP